jgi:hypothetical protein
MITYSTLEGSCTTFFISWLTGNICRLYQITKLLSLKLSSAAQQSETQPQTSGLFSPVSFLLTYSDTHRSSILRKKGTRVSQHWYLCTKRHGVKFWKMTIFATTARSHIIWCKYFCITALRWMSNTDICANLIAVFRLHSSKNVYAFNCLLKITTCFDHPTGHHQVTEWLKVFFNCNHFN